MGFSETRYCPPRYSCSSKNISIFHLLFFPSTLQTSPMQNTLKPNYTLEVESGGDTFHIILQEFQKHHFWTTAWSLEEAEHGHLPACLAVHYHSPGNGMYSSVENSSNGLIFREKGWKPGIFSAWKGAKNRINYTGLEKHEPAVVVFIATWW